VKVRTHVLARTAVAVGAISTLVIAPHHVPDKIATASATRPVRADDLGLVRQAQERAARDALRARLTIERKIEWHRREVARARAIQAAREAQRARDRAATILVAGDSVAWAHTIQEVFTRADDHQERLLHWNADHPTIPNAEPGALWSALWMRDSARVNPGKPDDSIWLAARCPSISGGYGNDWQVDAAASGGGFWTRTGDPRNPPSLSVTPSIQTGDYHGFLTQGVFTDHVG
jgi:hypothetical protein